jgi:SNW domain-containing protein 1
MDPASLRVSCVVQFISTVNKGKKGALDGIGRGGGLAAGGGGGSYEDYAGGGSGRRVDYQRGRA